MEPKVEEPRALPPDNDENNLPLGPTSPIPVGLEALEGLTHIFVKQQIEIFQILTGIETANRYEVLSENGQRIYAALETTKCCTRIFGGALRPFEIRIRDVSGREVLVLNRPCDWWLYCTANPLSCCCWCGRQGGNMHVNLPDGTRLGTIVHVYNKCKPKYNIVGSDGQILMTINGVSCGDCLGVCRCCCSCPFPIVSSTGVEIGAIRRKWSGLLKEGLTDADNFGVNFPIDLDIKQKALIFGAVFLIDFMYFQR